jgi:N6-L-threonylcarbamoyladenine synthase
LKAYLGFDTSCYTTSAAAALEDGGILDFRTPIPVAQGAVGIRQQEAVFLHVKALSQLVEGLMEALDQKGGVEIAGVGYSYAPTTREGSYMPVFLPGTSMGRSLAAALNYPVHGFSHQQGHVRAAEYGNRLPDEYLALHVSGGTTEILRVKKPGYDVNILGGTADISAGQTIDRVGVALGLPFPAGPHLESLALSAADSPYRFHSRDMGTQFSFSGMETAAQRYIRDGAEPGELALGLFRSIAKTLCRSIRHCVEETGLNTLLFSGGVCSNAILREGIQEELGDCTILFGQPKLCSDNGVGIALLCKEAVCSET